MTKEKKEDKKVAEKKEEIKLEKKPRAKKEKKKAVAKKKVDYTSIYEKEKAYPISEAVDIVRKITKTKFDSSLEVHFLLEKHSQSFPAA